MHFDDGSFFLWSSQSTETKATVKAEAPAAVLNLVERRGGADGGGL